MAEDGTENREEHTVIVTFRKTFDQRDYENPERFVESCLSGSRASSFATVERVEVIDK